METFYPDYFNDDLDADPVNEYTEHDAMEDEFEFGCHFPDECVMPGLHFRSECHTAEMIEAYEAAGIAEEE
jgi:3-hydroxymyristoyl/3-hydroxydecanoyl-(acyl carrier protein) dehydratase